MPRRNRNARPRLIGFSLRFAAKEHRRIYGRGDGNDGRLVRREPCNSAKRAAHIGATDLFESEKPKAP